MPLVDSRLISRRSRRRTSTNLVTKVSPRTIALAAYLSSFTAHIAATSRRPYSRYERVLVIWGMMPPFSLLIFTLNMPKPRNASLRRACAGQLGHTRHRAFIIPASAMPHYAVDSHFRMLHFQDADLRCRAARHVFDAYAATHFRLFDILPKYMLAFSSVSALDYRQGGSQYDEPPLAHLHAYAAGVDDDAGAVAVHAGTAAADILRAAAATISCEKHGLISLKLPFTTRARTMRADIGIMPRLAFDTSPTMPPLLRCFECHILAYE